MPRSWGNLGNAEEIFGDEEICNAVNVEERFGEGRFLDGAVITLLELDSRSIWLGQNIPSLDDMWLEKKKKEGGEEEKVE